MSNDIRSEKDKIIEVIESLEKVIENRRLTICGMERKISYAQADIKATQNLINKLKETL